MYSQFVRRPKSDLNNEVTVLPSGSKAGSFSVQFFGHWLHSGQVNMFVLIFFAPLPKEKRAPSPRLPYSLGHNIETGG